MNHFFIITSMLLIGCQSALAADQKRTVEIPSSAISEQTIQAVKATQLALIKEGILTDDTSFVFGEKNDISGYFMCDPSGLGIEQIQFAIDGPESHIRRYANSYDFKSYDDCFATKAAMLNNRTVKTIFVLNDTNHKVESVSQSPDNVGSNTAK